MARTTWRTAPGAAVGRPARWTRGPSRATRPHGQALLRLAGAVLAQGRHRGRVEGQRAPALGRLRLRDVDLVVHDHPGPARRDAAGFQVDVGPAEAGDLAAPHAGGGEQQPGRVEPVPAGVVEEGAELLGTPDMHLGRHALGQVGRGGERCRSARRRGRSTLPRGPWAEVPPLILQGITMSGLWPWIIWTKPGLVGAALLVGVYPGRVVEGDLRQKLGGLVLARVLLGPVAVALVNRSDEGAGVGALVVVWPLGRGY